MPILRLPGQNTGPIADLPNELPASPAEPQLPTGGIFTPRGGHGRGFGLISEPVIARTTAPFTRRNAQRIPPNIPANLAGIYSPIPTVYGKTRVVCEPVVMPRQIGRYWVCLYKVCKGEINSFQTVYIDGRESDVSAKTAATEFEDVTLVGSTGKVIFYVGTSGQDVSTWVSTYIPAYPDALPNQAVIAFKILDAYFSGLPRVEVLIEGEKGITDDRTSPVTTAYSNNAALCTAHFIETYHGRTVNAASKNTCADACDEAVGAGVRRTLNIALNRPQNTRITMQMLAAHAGCFLYDAGSEIKMIPDRPASKVFDIGEALVMGRTAIRKKGRSTKPGDVKVLWFDAVNNVQKPAFAIGTGPVDNPSVADLPGIDNYEQAKREAVERYNHSTLEDLTTDCVVRDEGLQIEIGDVVAFTDHTVAQGDKFGRVVNIGLDEPGRWALTLTEYQENAYSDSVETDPVSLDTDKPDPLDVPTITGLTVSTANEEGEATISATWDAVTWEWAQRIQVQILNTDNSPDTEEWIRNVVPDTTSTKARGFDAGTGHQVKARIVSKISPNVRGAWATANVTTLPDRLLHRWPFDGTTTVAALAANVGGVDFSEITGGEVTAGQTAKVGTHAIKITGDDGEGIRSTSSDVDITPPFTRIGWFKVTTAPAVAATITIAEHLGTAVNYSMQINNGRSLTVNYDDGSPQAWVTGKTLALDTWYLMALSHDTSQFVLQINADTPISEIGTMDTVAAGSRSLSHRAGSSGVAHWDHWRLYRTALTVAEFAVIYAAEN